MGRSRIVPGDGDPRHGTSNGYVNLRCRTTAEGVKCDTVPSCRDAHAKACADLRVKRKGQLDPDDERHGKPATYRNHGCTCLPCRAANAKDVADRRAKRKVAP